MQSTDSFFLLNCICCQKSSYASIIASAIRLILWCRVSETSCLCSTFTVTVKSFYFNLVMTGYSSLANKTNHLLRVWGSITIYESEVVVLHTMAGVVTWVAAWSKSAIPVSSLWRPTHCKEVFTKISSYHQALLFYYF